MNIKIIIAAHKLYDLPQDALYLPVHVGAALCDIPLPYTRDDSGENISKKNKSFCELTALYWAWKNVDADFIGLCHYRRYFCKPCSREVLQLKDAEKLVLSADMILPQKRNYFIETNYSQYVHAHHAADLELTRLILNEQDPKAVPCFDRVMGKTSGHRFNMLIMSRQTLDEYCTWLFGILFELGTRLDVSGYSDYDGRVFGFVAERLLDVWIETYGKHYMELPYIFTEKQNWFKKGSAFLKRKFFPRKD